MKKLPYVPLLSPDATIDEKVEQSRKLRNVHIVLTVISGLVLADAIYTHQGVEEVLSIASTAFNGGMSIRNDLARVVLQQHAIEPITQQPIDQPVELPDNVYPINASKAVNQ
jgi:hypothetical protein